MKSVFFYGLFMDREHLRRLGFGPTEPVPAVLEGFGLRIGERASLVAAKAERAYGVVMALPAIEVQQLYAEESVAAYQPETVVVRGFDGQSYPVVVYNLPPDLIKGKNKTYATALRALALNLGLPPQYIEELKQWMR